MAMCNRLARKATPTSIISHWPKLIQTLSFSPQEFYKRVEDALGACQIPSLKVSRVDWKEGGILSARREYLRLQRERLVFDICAAPFGTGFFVSIWFGEKPLKLAGFLLAIIVLAAIWIVVVAEPRIGIYWFFTRNFRIYPYQINLFFLGVMGLLCLILLIRVARDLDAALMGLPIIGYFYERYFRAITYYRIDLRCMYQAAVLKSYNQKLWMMTRQ